MTVKTYMLVLAMFMLSSCTTVQPTSPPTSDAPPGAVTNYWRSVLYPAHVTAIQWGHVMSAGRGVSWTRWTTRFGDDAPVARFGTVGGTEDANVEIRGLSCSNEVDGTHSCYLLMINDRRHGPQCMFIIGGEGDNYSTHLGVRCPYSISF